jgi:predicted acyltransferase
MKNERLLSLDVFRGITIAAMILVNNPGLWGSVYAPLCHASWHGLTPTDLIFPFFMFIMGTSMAYAFARFDHHIDRPFLAKLLRRTIVLFVIGMAISLFGLLCNGAEDPLGHIRILGVLQRLALAYFFGGLAVMSIKRTKTLLYTAAGILAAYAVVLFCGHGLELSEQNIIGVVDRALFGADHIYREWLPDGSRIAFDPEGLISTLPGIAQVIFGYVCGTMLREKTNLPTRLMHLAVLGIALLFAGLLLSYGCPLNKKVWTPTFVLTTCGFATLSLLLLTWIIDVRGAKRWATPFQAFGLNPLAIYVAAAVVGIPINVLPREGLTIQEHCYQAIAAVIHDPYFASLCYSLLFIFVCYLLAWALYRKHIVIKL